MAEHHVEVQVLTTSGSFPENGFDQIPANQPVRIFLTKAQKELEIASIEGWVAIADNREIDVNRSYADNNLRGQVKLDWGPREGGGGSA